jgi:hypothetical protein
MGQSLLTTASVALVVTIVGLCALPGHQQETFSASFAEPSSALADVRQWSG